MTTALALALLWAGSTSMSAQAADSVAVARSIVLKNATVNGIYADTTTIVDSAIINALSNTQECTGNIAPAIKPNEHYAMLTIGTANSLDTYLSPLTYRGTELRFTSQTMHFRHGRQWTHTFTHGLRLSRQTMHTGDGVRLEGGYDLSYSWQRKIFNHPMGYWGYLWVTAGGGVDGTIGFRYNPNNSNNPAQAEAALAFTPALTADWRFFRHRRAYGLRYEVAVPMAGVMFSPAYGQSYYEIFSRGNYDHNLCPIWVGNAPSLRQRLLFTFPLLRRACFVGYLGDYRQARVNDLKYHRYTHAATFGWKW